MMTVLAPSTNPCSFRNEYGNLFSIIPLAVEQDEAATAREGDIMKEATFQDAVTLAQKLNLDKESVWKIIEGK